MLRLNCECGRVLNYKPELIGKKVRCPGCQTSLELPDPDAEVVELEPVEEEPAPARKPASRRPAPRDDEDDDRPRRRPSRAAADDDDDDDRPRRRSRRDDDEDEADERPRRRPARLLDAADDDDRPRRRREEDEAPRRRPRRAVASSGFLPRLAEGLCSQGGFAIMAVLAVLGGMAVFYGFREMRLASGAGAAPRQVTLTELIAGGPGQNNHVQLSGFVPGDNFVYQVTMKKSDRLLNRDKSTLPWKAVYVPLLPPDNARANAAPPEMPGLPGIRRLNGDNAGPSGPIRVLLLSHKAKNQGELASLCSGGSIQGMIINSISSLESETQKMLQQAYPGTNFSQVMILEAGRAPSSALFSMAAMAGGAGMIVLALALGGVALIFRPR